jgi:hypothetical protein
MPSLIPSFGEADDGPALTAHGPTPTDPQTIKHWTRESLHLDEDAVVTVMEFTCSDPGCPQIETVIAVFDATGARKWKLLCAQAALNKITVQQALAAAPAGTGQKIEPHAHPGDT